MGEAFLRDGGEERFGGFGPEVVEDDVYAGAGEFGAEGGGEGFRGLVERDDGVGTEGFEFFEGFGVASDGDDVAGAAAFGDLHG